MSFEPGTVFAGDYRVVKPLSEGGMGAVFVVQQLSTGKMRALKLMHSSLVYDPPSRAKFEQEARIGSRIASEHVVEVVAAGVDAQTQVPYLVMELLEGEDMHARLKRGPYTPAEAALVLEQIAHALGAAHDAGVIHRDLKPENVFLGVSKRSSGSLIVKLLDFGIAKVTEEHQRNTTGAYGTPLWLAPEQTRRGEITPAADVWAFGLLSFLMLTGHHLWRSVEGPNPSLPQLISEITQEPIPSASSRAIEYAMRLPPGYDAWLSTALQRDPRMRFPNARAAWQALAPILTAQTTFAQPASPPVPEKPKRSIVLPIVLVLVGLLLVAGVAIASVAFYASRQPTRTVVQTTPPVATPTPTPTPTLTPSQAPTSTPTPTQTPPRAGHLNCFMQTQSQDTTIQDDFVSRYQKDLAGRMEDCLTEEPESSFFVSVHLKADGSVGSAQIPYSKLSHTTCLVNAVKATQFAPGKRANDVTMICTWKK